MARVIKCTKEMAVIDGHGIVGYYAIDKDCSFRKSIDVGGYFYYIKRDAEQHIPNSMIKKNKEKVYYGQVQ